MSELRLNQVTREWVIIASERAKRPIDFMNSRSERPQSPPFLGSCPFCPGNEHRTPAEQFRTPADGGWKIRVVSNKYPALTDGEKKRTADGFRRSVTGVGIHEVIIESPIHNMSISSMEHSDVAELVRTYKRRFLQAHRDPRIEHVIIFKNHGEGAGTTLDHPHTQLIGTPVVPVQFRERVQSAMHYFDDTGECLLCAILRKEIEEGVRVLNDTGHFLTFIPYAALSPFHTWIFPKRHSAAFSSITEDEITDLAFHMKAILSRFYRGLDDPDFNYVIKSSRPEDDGNEYCHWYLSIVPRLTKAAGFELGSGMYINASLPEKSAEFIRSVRVE